MNDKNRRIHKTTSLLGRNNIKSLLFDSNMLKNTTKNLDHSRPKSLNILKLQTNTINITKRYSGFLWIIVVNVSSSI